VAQVLYFYRNLKPILARAYNPDLVGSPKWQDSAIRGILDDLRGVPFGYFANGTARLQYENEPDSTSWVVSVYRNNRRAHPTKALAKQMEKWAKEWAADPKTLGRDQGFLEIFIPTERAYFTRLKSQPSVLYAPYQPLLFKQFADHLASAGEIYQIFLRERAWLEPAQLEIFDFVLARQKEALKGDAYVPKAGHKLWKWRFPVEHKNRIIPIEATASGQMEAWPIFIIAATGGTHFKYTTYIEEPETHLHPMAQWVIMKTIAFLINRGRRFLITTHSPFIIYALNNMLQRYQSLRGQIPQGQEAWIDPSMVAAYRLSRGQAIDIMEHGEIGLINAEELEEVAEDLGTEFEDLLSQMD